MLTHMYTRSAAAVATLCACVGIASGAAAQGRFELVRSDAVTGVQGLAVYTVRDNGTAFCYTLFVLGGSDVESSRSNIREPGVTAADLEKVRVAELLKEAMAIRDQRIAELRSPRTLGWQTPQLDTERDRIDEEYERAVREVLPHLYPAARNTPGIRSTSTDVLNEAVRQAIADADAVAAAGARASLEDQMLHALDVITRAPRLAVAGPSPCSLKTASPPPR